MNKLHGRSQSWIITLLLVGASVAFLSVVFLPGKRAIGELRDELRTSQEFVAAAGSLSVAIDAAQEELDRTRQYNAIWRPKPADSAGVATLFGSIAQEIKRSGAVSTRFAPQAETAYVGMRKIPLNVSCEGAFEALHGLLVGLETSCPGVWVTNVEFGRSSENGQTARCDLDLVIFAENDKSSD